MKVIYEGCYVLAVEIKGKFYVNARGETGPIKVSDEREAKKLAIKLDIKLLREAEEAA